MRPDTSYTYRLPPAVKRTNAGSLTSTVVVPKVLGSLNVDDAHHSITYERMAEPPSDNGFVSNTCSCVGPASISSTKAGADGD